MSFDLYFLAREPGRSWEDAMAELEDVDELPLDDASLGRWGRVRAALTSVLPDATEFVGDTNRELSDDATGIQVSMFAGELSLTVPYWYSGLMPSDWWHSCAKRWQRSKQPPDSSPTTLRPMLHSSGRASIPQPRRSTALGDMSPK